MSRAADPSERPDLAARLTELEMLFMHLQRTVQDLNDVVLHHGEQLDQLDRRLAALAAILPALDAAPPGVDEGGTPPDDSHPSLRFGAEPPEEG